MSQYIRIISVPNNCQNVAVEKDGKCFLKKTLTADIIILNQDVDDDVEEMTSLDFTSARSRLTVKKGFSAEHPLPKSVIWLLGLLGITLDPCVTIALAALYTESRFNDYSREECDKMFLNTLLQPVTNSIAKAIIYDILMMVIGNNYVWNNSSDKTVVATLEPIWNT